MEGERLRSLKKHRAEEAEDPIEALGAIAACLAIGLMLDGTRIIGGDDGQFDVAGHHFGRLAIAFGNIVADFVGRHFARKL